MKFLGIILCLTTCITYAKVTDKALLGVAIMVKNEETVLAKTLEPFAQAGINHMIVYDTGSTDNTPEVARKFFKEHSIKHGLVIKEKFIDFAASRNRLLDLAKQHFPNTTFIIMPDAEWYLNSGQELINFCKQQLNNPTNAYIMHVLNKETGIYRPCLFRNNCKARFKGRVHECIELGVQVVPDCIYFTRGLSEKGRTKTKERFIQDREFLLQSYAEDPHDPHTVFFLAQTYSCLGELATAYKYYQERMKLPGCNENLFETLLRMGALIDILSRTDANYSWDAAHKHYLEAFNLRPHRAEPLVMIAEHYIKNNQPELAFVFAQRACQLPIPQEDYNGVDLQTYNFDRYALLSTCAVYVHEYAIGLWATEQAYKAKPQFAHLQEQIAMYKAHLTTPSTLTALKQSFIHA